MSVDGSVSASRTSTQNEKSAAALYTPEEQVFHRLFPQVPLSEKLVESRQCALTTKKKKFARMGTLYASSLRVCFGSSFLRDPIMVRWEDVTSVDKDSNFIFDSIVIKTRQEEELMFSGFLSGGTGQIFKLLRTLWTVRARYVLSGAALPVQASIPPPAIPLPRPSKSPDLLPSPSEGDTLRGEGGGREEEEEEEKEERENSSNNSVAPIKPIITEILPSTPPNNGTKSDPDTMFNSDKSNENEEKSNAAPMDTSKKFIGQDSAPEKYEVLQQFPSIPKSEPLIDYFQCSYASGVHRIGRLYITTNYILFSSVMMAERLQISFKDVKGIEKEQTMMILDGIAVRLNNGPTHSFTSFVSRDAAFNILTHFFNVMKMLNPPTQNIPYVIDTVDGKVVFTTKTSEADVSKFPVVDSLNEFSKVLTDYGTALSDFSCFTKELMDPVVLPEGKTVLDVFKVCFDDGTSLMEEYHRDRKDTDQKWELWRPALTGSPPFSGQRLFTCTTIIRALVAKSCPFTEYQRYAFMNVGGREPTLVVQFSGQASGVMFADAFRAEALLVFAQNDSKLTMRAFGYIQFLRDVWVKGKILRTSIDNEMPECYRGLSSMLTERLKQISLVRGVTNTTEETLNSTTSTEKALVSSLNVKYFRMELIYNVNFLQIEGFLYGAIIFLLVLGLFASLIGLYSVFFMNLDEDSWQLCGGSGKEGLLFLGFMKTFFEFLRPTILFLLALGILNFYQLLTREIFSL
ncbi:VASt domain [Trypanosoma melophagium]|uniref:VASt domain n=1 Tax=Trypanosoma melophagium TaxID=715481 RepID=UPI00351A712C|nr:VASt domain [Trypanosoma melophagium]